MLEAVEQIRQPGRPRQGPGDDRRRSCASSFGFTKEKQWTPVGDLSGGERRRLQLLRLLMDEPNVLFLDEPTNDLDIETLTQLEDLLDGWPGSLVVISHDRYFIERTTDRVFALLGDRDAADAAARHRRVPGAPPRRGGGGRSGPPPASGAAAAKPKSRPRTPGPRRRNSSASSGSSTSIGRQGDAPCTPRSPTTPTDFEKVAELDAELRALGEERDELEMRWLELADEV